MLLLRSTQISNRFDLDYYITIYNYLYNYIYITLNILNNALSYSNLIFYFGFDKFIVTNNKGQVHVLLQIQNRTSDNAIMCLQSDQQLQI